jgi:hypothetical protein
MNDVKNKNKTIQSKYNHNIMEDPIVLEELRTSGYVILRGFQDFSQAHLQNLETLLDEHEGQVLFNARTQRRGKRWQVTLPHNSDIFQLLVPKLLALFPENIITEGSVLVAEPGCHEQIPHMDYPSDVEGVYSAILCASVDGSTLNVWPQSHRMVFSHASDFHIQKKKLALNLGDCVVFRGDLVHSGSSYRKYNVRIHFYLDHLLVTRTKDTTHPVFGLINNVRPRGKARKLKKQKQK